MIAAIAFCICGCLLCIVVRQYLRPHALLMALAVCCMLILSVIPQVWEILETAGNLFSLTGMNYDYFLILCKAIGISYLTQLGMDFCRDCGENAICTAVELFGRISLISLSLPLFTVLIDLILEVIG